jgi:hypothetical protein
MAATREEPAHREAKFAREGQTMRCPFLALVMGGVCMGWFAFLSILATWDGYEIGGAVSVVFLGAAATITRSVYRRLTS